MSEQGDKMSEIEEIKEYVRHLKVLCPTSLDVQYFESLLSSLEKAQIYIEQLRGALGYSVSGDIRENPEIKNGIAEALYQQLEKEKEMTVIWEKEAEAQRERVKELELRISVLELPARSYNKTLVRAEKSESNLQRFVEAVERHRQMVREAFSKYDLHSVGFMATIETANEELYKVLEEVNKEG